MQYYLILLIFITIGCNPPGNKTEHPAEITKIALEKYQDHFNFLQNKDTLYVICFRQDSETALNPTPPLRFFVFDVKNKKIIFEDNLPNGSVKWIDKYKIGVKTIPGIIRKDEILPEYTYVYDVLLKKKLK